MARFDWMQASIDAFPRVVTDALMAELPGASSLAHGRGRQNYHHSTSVLTSCGDVLATVLHGGPNGAPNATATGVNADPFAAVIRRHWPDAHRVSRVDSAEDVHGSFPAIMAACRTIGQAFRIKGQLIAPDDPADGATYYLGAPSSSTRFRAYEKGKHERASSADPDAIRDDWVRLEVQHRPIRDAKRTAASLTAGELWGVSPWCQRIAQEVLLKAPERVHQRPRLLTTFERRNAALARQYGSHMIDLHRRCGHDDEAFGALLIALARGTVGTDAE